MPLQTFDNLPEEKKELITQVAIEEFALNDYQSASVTNIVKVLNISKGGFYRYFRDKKDLYFYLIDYVTKKRMAHVNDLFLDTNRDFFDLLVENFAMKIRFDLKNPLYGGFLFNVIQEKNSEEIGNMQQQTKQSLMGIVIKFVESFINKGKLRNNVPAEIISYLIIETQFSVLEYLYLKHNINIRENIRSKKPVYSISEEEILSIVMDFTEILKNGIKA